MAAEDIAANIDSVMDMSAAKNVGVGLGAPAH
jgi:hypothetical protein